MNLMPEPRIIITAGEPAGIGPDIIASIDPARFEADLTVIGDRNMLQSRAAALGSNIEFTEYTDVPVPGKTIAVIDLPLEQPSVPGQLDCANAQYVLTLLEHACKACLKNQFDAMVTAPVQKEIINRAGISFSGHTEYLADICNAPKPVMLLVAEKLKVALVTTHLPLRQVADAINDLGFLHYQGGLGLPANPQKALTFFERAADLRHPQAQFNFAALIDDGLIPNKDPEDAAQYLYAALRSGSSDVLKLLSERPTMFTDQTRKALQAKLKDNDFYQGSIDGDFGPGTQRGIRRAYGLDG